MRSGYRRSAGLAGLLLAVSCSSQTPAEVTAQPAPTEVSPSPTATATPTAAAVDPASVKANELGDIPVLMYHQLLDKPRGVYDQTPAEYRAELELLYKTGYRTVTAADLVAGRIELPAGRSPMVLTFDDSTVSQYGELADGSVDPASAVGILLEVAARYDEPRPVATFYVNAAPFAGKPAYLASLAKLGMELGEHTASHANLKKLDDAGVQRELREGLAAITSAVPDAKVTTMALPFGAHPRNGVLAHRGTGYDFAGVMLVGSNPARSPYHEKFDPLAVPRIRSGLRTGDQAFTSTDWLPKMASTRYISDGNPATISFPKALAGRLAPRLAGQANPY